MEPAGRGFRWYAERVGGLLVLASVLALTIIVTGKDDATNTETALWTFVLFSIGLSLSYYFGKQSVAGAAKELVRSQAKAAARRLVTLGAGLNSIREDLEQHRQAAADAASADNEVSLERIEMTAQSVNIHLDLQKKMVIDALEDWRQFDPEMANELLEDDAESD